MNMRNMLNIILSSLVIFVAKKLGYSPDEIMEMIDDFNKDDQA